MNSAGAQPPDTGQRVLGLCASSFTTARAAVLALLTHSTDEAAQVSRGSLTRFAERQGEHGDDTSLIRTGPSGRPAVSTSRRGQLWLLPPLCALGPRAPAAPVASCPGTGLSSHSEGQRGRARDSGDRHRQEQGGRSGVCVQERSVAGGSIAKERSVEQAHIPWRAPETHRENSIKDRPPWDK